MILQMISVMAVILFLFFIVLTLSMLAEGLRFYGDMALTAILKWYANRKGEVDGWL